MSEFNIEVAGGSSVRLPVDGKYCDRDIVITATGGSGYGRQLVENTAAEIYDDSVENIRRAAFTYCTSLAYVDFPKVLNIAQNAFTGCSGLEYARFKSLKALVGIGHFSNCTALKEIDLGENENITTGCFAGCSGLDTIILRGDKICSLATSAAFNGTPFMDAGGAVYCKSALIEEYKIATNWSSLYEFGTCNFVAIEGSEYE